MLSTHRNLPPFCYFVHQNTCAHVIISQTALKLLSGHSGLVVGRSTAVREDPGSNLTAAGLVYHDSHCDIQPWARVVHPYCSAGPYAKGGLRGL